jgi:hypothetical protein
LGIESKKTLLSTFNSHSFHQLEPQWLEKVERERLCKFFVQLVQDRATVRARAKLIVGTLVRNMQKGMLWLCSCT